MTGVSTRPVSVVQSDIEVTRAAMDVCRAVITKLLAERRHLLSLGWPVEHALCLDLDQDATKWAGQQEYQRRALQRLLQELDPTESGPQPAESRS